MDYLFLFIHQDACKSRARELENNYIDRSWPDQPFNFILGNDGLIYEGRGWMNQGTISNIYGDEVLTIGFLADHNYYKPSVEQLKLLDQLLNMGLKLEHISQKYFIYALCQSRPDIYQQSPGKEFYNIITKWPEWSDYSDFRVLKNCTFD